MGCGGSWTRAFDVVSPALHDQCTSASSAGLASMDLALLIDPINRSLMYAKALASVPGGALHHTSGPQGK